MKQLFYTSCIAGRSLSGNSGFQVRAVSEGVSAEDIRHATMYASYVLPADLRPSDESIKAAPVRLATFDTDELGRIICQSVYVGKDPVTGRWGNFFSHVLLDVPGEIDPPKVLRSWSSDFWRRDDREGATVLEDIAALESGDRLTRGVLAGFLNNKKQRGVLEFILSALVESPDYRIVVAAPTDIVVTALQSTMIVISPLAAKHITFSTYESDPLSCPAKISATCSMNPESQLELPSSAYSGGFRAINFYSDRQSRLKPSLFARFALKALGSANGYQQLKTFRKLCDDLEIDSLPLHETFFSVASASEELSLSADNITCLLDNTAATEWVLNRKQSANKFLKAAVALGETEDHYDQLAPDLAQAIGRSNLLESSSPPIDAPLIELCQAWCTVEQYRRSPTIDAAGSEELSEALELVPTKSARRLIIDSIPKLSDQLAACSTFTGEELIVVVKRLGRLLEGKESSLFRLIFTQLRKGRTAAFRTPRFSSAIASVLCDPIIRKSITQGQAKAIVRQIKVRGGPGMMKAIHERAQRKWPKPNQRYWLKLTRWYLWRPTIIKWGLVVTRDIVLIVVILAGLYYARHVWPEWFSWLPDLM